MLPVYIYLVILFLFYACANNVIPFCHAAATSLVDLVIFILPLLLIVWLLIRARSYFKKRQYLYVALFTSMPGAIFGLNITHAFLGLGTTEHFLEALITYIASALFFGIISALSGLIINLAINTVRRFK